MIQLPLLFHRCQAYMIRWRHRTIVHTLRLCRSLSKLSVSCTTRATDPPACRPLFNACQPTSLLLLHNFHTLSLLTNANANAARSTMLVASCCCRLSKTLIQPQSRPPLTVAHQPPMMQSHKKRFDFYIFFQNLYFFVEFFFQIWFSIIVIFSIANVRIVK